MASKTFNLGDGSEGTGSCGKFCMILCCLLILGVIIVAAIYAYNSNMGGGGGGSGCSVPKLDEKGMSNWTSGAEIIAYTCLPTFYLEGDSDVMLANCENGEWTPSPPACNQLPLRLDCELDYEGISGNVTVYQANKTDPMFIYGLVNYTDFQKYKDHVFHKVVHISKASCQISNEIDSIGGDMFSTETESSESKLIQINYNTTAMKAYNKAELHMTLILIDNFTTASLVSVHQGNLTLIVSSTIPTKDMARRYLTQEEYELSVD